MSTPEPTEAPTDGGTPTTYTVQPGDTLSAVAGRVYGDRDQWQAIFEANRDALGQDPGRIRPGTELTLPPQEAR